MVRYITKKYLGKGCVNGRKRAGLILSLMGIGLNLLLFGIKYAAGVISDSIAITADGFNNLADTGACLLVVLGLKLGDRRPCRRYPFGYGRYEYLSGMLIGGTVIALGCRLMAHSVTRVMDPEPIEGKPVVILMLLFSIIVKGYMYHCNRHIGAAADAAGLKAAATDALADCVATAAIIAAIIVEELTGVNIDGYTGALVALCITWAGIGAVRESLEPLLGRGISEPLQKRIDEIIRRHPGIRSAYGVALHDYGPQNKLLTMHVTLGDDSRGCVDILRRELSDELHLSAVIAIENEVLCTCGIKPDKTVNNNTG